MMAHKHVTSAKTPVFRVLSLSTRTRSYDLGSKMDTDTEKGYVTPVMIKWLGGVGR